MCVSFYPSGLESISSCVVRSHIYISSYTYLCFQRIQGPWHRTGNSRIVFTSGLNDDSMVDSGGGAGTGDAGSTGNTPPATAGGSQKEDGAGRARGGGSSSFSSSAAQWSRVRHGCWKEELKANACNVPRVRLNELNEHRCVGTSGHGGRGDETTQRGSWDSLCPYSCLILWAW